MFEHAKQLMGFTAAASDGELGSVEDLYFDDEMWTIRYLVVNTGPWLTGRLVLVSPIAVERVDRERGHVVVSLTREQVERSPSIEEHRPVSRQYEADHAAYYGYPAYWGGPGLWGWAGYPGAIAGLEALEQEQAEQAARQAAGPPSGPVEDVHLRSISEVTGYGIEATDGEIGYLRDFVIDERSWAIRLLIVDTSNWWIGKKVLISPDWLEEIRWADRRVKVGVSREAVRNSPEWDKRAPIDEQFEDRLSRHYGRERRRRPAAGGAGPADPGFPG